MGRLIKTRAQREMERELSLRKAMNTIKRHINNLGQNEKGYVAKARRAKQIGAGDQLNFLKSTLKKTASQRRLMERQLLNIETAKQIRDQTKAHAEFAKAMNVISRSIAQMFKGINLVKTQANFEKAMVNAQSVEEKMDLLLEVTSESLFGYEGEQAGTELVSDEEIDRMIEASAEEEESAGIDTEIESGLKEVEKELGNP